MRSRGSRNSCTINGVVPCESTSAVFTADRLARAQPAVSLAVIEISFGHLAANLLPLDSHNSNILRAAN